MRLLRCARLIGRFGFELDPEVLACLGEAGWSEVLRAFDRKLSRERMAMEVFGTQKQEGFVPGLLGTQNPGPGLRVLERLGCFQRVFPGTSFEGTLEQAFARLEHGSSDPQERALANLAFLSLHGKESLTEVLRLPKSIARRVRAIVEAAQSIEKMVGAEGSCDDVRRLVAQHGEHLTLGLPLVRARRGDANGKGLAILERRVRQELLALERRPEFPVRGADLLAIGIPPGPEVGTWLARLRTRFEQNPELDREALLRQVDLALGDEGES